jgi:hypothetical protein
MKTMMDEDEVTADFRLPSARRVNRCRGTQADLPGTTPSFVEELAEPGNFAEEILPRLEVKGTRVSV